MEDESSLPQKDARTSLARFNEQIQPIYNLLQECEDVRLAPALLEPEPTDIRKLTRSALGRSQAHDVLGVLVAGASVVALAVSVSSWSLSSDLSC